MAGLLAMYMGIQLTILAMGIIVLGVFQVPVPVVQQQTTWLINLENQLPSIITSIATLLGVAFTGWIGIKNIVKRQEEKSDVTSQKVEEVKEDLKTTNEDVKSQLVGLHDIAKDTHTLVNNNMAIQLHLNAISARRLAQTVIASDSPDHDKLEEYTELANKADDALVDHLHRQAAMDLQVKAREAERTVKQ